MTARLRRSDRRRAPAMVNGALVLAAAAVVLVVLVWGACGGTTEIVLVVDTDLNVPVDMDTVEISVAGSMPAGAPISVRLDVEGAPRLPLTLGLVQGGGKASAVTVTAVGLSQGKPIVQQQARTAFVGGQQRMLRLVLSASCVAVPCSDAAQTCDAGACGPADRPAAALPPWTGQPPARPGPPATTPINGRTVWASGWRSCAVEGKALYCWGQNSDGQVGSGTTQNANARRRAMNVHDPAAIGLGHFHSCVCDHAGQASCWGRNAEGELGDGTTAAELVAAPVPGVADCAQIAGGAQHACVLRAGGRLGCWGSNASGQIGLPAGTAPVTTPQPVADLAGVAEVVAGEKYTCARLDDGTVRCWGDNSSGQLGDGTNASRPDARAVTALGSDIVEIAGGRFFACARHATGKVSCWGQNPNGQLGNGLRTDSNVPVDVGGVDDAVQLVAGLQHACALRRTGVLSCWGGNQYGQLGNGTLDDAPAPTDVVDIDGVTSVAAGSVHTCARHVRGLACWGENIVNQLGDGTTNNRSRPVSVAGFL